MLLLVRGDSAQSAVGSTHPSPSMSHQGFPDCWVGWAVCRYRTLLLWQSSASTSWFMGHP